MKEKTSKHSHKESRSEHKHKKKKHSHDRHSKVKHKHYHKDNVEGRRHVEVTITPDDYFVRNEEFRVWLKLDRRRYVALAFLFWMTQQVRPFEELDSIQTHKYFEEFCEKWNDGELTEMYYTGILVLIVTSFY